MESEPALFGESQAAVRFAQHIESRKLGELPGRLAVRRYVHSVNQFNEYMQRIRFSLPKALPLPMLPRQHPMKFCRRVYRLWRVTPRDALFELLAQEAARWVNDWASPEQVAAAARTALVALSNGYSEPELAALAQFCLLLLKTALRQGPCASLLL